MSIFNAISNFFIAASVLLAASIWFGILGPLAVASFILLLGPTFWIGLIFCVFPGVPIGVLTGLLHGAYLCYSSAMQSHIAPSSWRDGLAGGFFGVISCFICEAWITKDLISCLSFSSKCDFRFSLIIFLACFAGAAGAFCAIYFGNWARQELKPLSKHLSGRATATLAPPSES